MVDALNVVDLPQWRKDVRRRLIDARRVVPAAEFDRRSARVNEQLRAALLDLPTLSVALYWPMKREVDLRSLAPELVAHGFTTCLPAAMQRKAPMKFFEWTPGTELAADAHGIPIPAHAREVVPDIALAPLVGFDDQGYRLGYGMGYFDRTLATLANPPVTIGIGTHDARIESIVPQSHDIPMDVILTERGWLRAIDGKLQPAPKTALSSALDARRIPGSR